MDYTEAEIAHFWSRVWIGEPDDCWPWLGAISDNGYGTAVFKRKSVGAHRAAFAIFYHEKPPMVLHKCDRRWCVNPRHLFAGNGKANADDRDSKGRGNWDTPALGEANGNATMTVERVVAMRERAACGESGASLARAYGISTTNASKIIRRLSWTHVP